MTSFFYVTQDVQAAFLTYNESAQRSLAVMFSYDTDLLNNRIEVKQQFRRVLSSWGS